MTQKEKKESAEDALEEETLQLLSSQQKGKCLWDSGVTKIFKTSKKTGREV